MFNYVLRRRQPATYVFRNGKRIVDATGTLAGTIAVVFIRQEYAKPGSSGVIIDIGANMGCFALHAAMNSRNPEMKIYCFEPEKQNYKVLSENIKQNSFEGKVFAYNYAVAAESGSRQMNISNSPLNSLVIGSGSKGSCEVECITLKEIMAEHDLENVDLLKVNCEGAEYEIFQNCGETELKRIKNIRLEYHNIDDDQKNGRALASLLVDRGYQIDRFSNYRNVSGFIWARRVDGGGRS